MLTDTQLQTSTITGKTTLYGRVIGVMGEHPPRVSLRLLSDEQIECDVREDEQNTLARELGKRLYGLVGVRGIAKWDIHDLTLKSFEVDAITPYTEKSLTAAMDDLRNTIGDRFESLPDAAALRGNEAGG